MPTTRPDMSTSAPPELPGLMAASVWIAGYVVLRLCCGCCSCSPNGSWGVCSCSEDTETGRFSADDDAGRHGRVKSVRRADRDHGLPHLQRARLAERSGGQVVHPVDLDDRDVGHRVGADDGGLLGGAVVEVDRDRAVVAGAGDDVVVGEDLTVLGQDDARAGARTGLARHVDLHHRGQHCSGHLLDGSVLDECGRRRLVLARCVRGGGRRAVVLEGVERGGAADAGRSSEDEGTDEDRRRQPAVTGQGLRARSAGLRSRAAARVRTEAAAGCSCPQRVSAARTRGACRRSRAGRCRCCRRARSGSGAFCSSMTPSVRSHPESGL